MVGQIILGVLGVLIGSGGLIAFVIGLVKPPKVSPEELADFDERNLKKSKIGYIPPLKHIGGGMFTPNDVL